MRKTKAKPKRKAKKKVLPYRRVVEICFYYILDGTWLQFFVDEHIPHRVMRALPSEPREIHGSGGLFDNGCDAESFEWAMGQFKKYFPKAKFVYRNPDKE